MEVQSSQSPSEVYEVDELSVAQSPQDDLHDHLFGVNENNTHHLRGKI
ncbi:MAG: hypothetical protein ACXADW_19370 [Candidatus Hodarchaeales archaeon]|jgi:hypothetical protein